jgi:hypothetical protein
MKLHELLNNSQGNTGMTKLSAEQVEGIMKRAGEILDERMSAISFSEEIAKVASAEIENMNFSDPELQKVASELLSYGAGLADGEMITKQAMVPVIYEEAYATFISKIAEVMGPEAAEEVDSSLREAGGEEQAVSDEIDAVKEEITENVAEALVEQAGGLEAVQQDPELSADILEQSSEVAEQIVEENLAGE